MKTLSIFLAVLSFTVISCNTNSNLTKPIVEGTETDLLTLDFWSDYSIESYTYGTITNVKIEGENRIIETNALPNHKVGEFPNPGNPNTIAAQSLKYTIPINPVFSGESAWAREPGIALNGIKFEPETAERFVCESGEVYRIEAFQNLVDLGLDFNHAHVQPTGAYHYHGAPTELIKALDKGEDLILIGFAHDGFPIYYSKSGKYKPSFKLASDLRTGDLCSYTTRKSKLDKELKNTKPDGTFVSDWEYIKGVGDLDECNGITINDSYAYFLTDDYPYMGRCLKGKTNKKARKGPPPGGQGRKPKE